MNLVEAEAVSSLVSAETEVQRQFALKACGHQDLSNWRTRLIIAMAHLEAVIDFGDAEDIEDDQDILKVRETLEGLRDDIQAALENSFRGELYTEGIRTVIYGDPNVGKSSLFNLLVKREACIVSPNPGTTRDVVGVPIDIAGFPVLLRDTAGIRKNVDDLVEREGVRRSRLEAESADLKIGVTTPGVPFPHQADDDNTILVTNKIDLAKAGEPTEKSSVQISCRTGQGLDLLMAKLGSKLAKFALRDHDSQGRETHAFSERQRRHLEDCLASLRNAIQSADVVSMAEELRQGANHIGMVTGDIKAEAVLTEVFSRFCIGK